MISTFEKDNQLDDARPYRSLKLDNRFIHVSALPRVFRLASQDALIGIGWVVFPAKGGSAALEALACMRSLARCWFSVPRWSVVGSMKVLIG